MTELSIIIATFNSSKTLPLVFESIKKQTIYSKKIEMIVVDAGSRDRTLSLARSFGSRVIKNTNQDPVSGKHLGYLKSRGRSIMFLDHDEVLKNLNSLEKKLKVLTDNKNVKAVAGGNYVSPKNYSFVNDYINDFGDPFSFFMYRISKRNGFFLNSMKKRFKILKETKDFVVFDLSDVNSLPIFELAAGASMFDAEFLKKEFPETLTNKNLLPHFFYLIHKKYSNIAVMKKDPIVHYSSDTTIKYLKKISWRVRNNVHFANDLGLAGFSGRETYAQGKCFKKYLFIPYSFSIIFPLIDSLMLAITRKNIYYLMHLPLSFFTAYLIVYHYFLKTCRIRPVLRNYGT